MTEAIPAQPPQQSLSGKAKARQRHALNRALEATLWKLRSEETDHGAEAP
ncbi:hypothetical protein [Roseateles depolymerans]|nr:hypothetical protein [Roseateles depolymerans]